MKYLIRSKGFTLIEMLIVIVILCILYTAATAHLLGLQNEAKKSRANADLRTLELAINTYYKNNDQYPRGTDYQIILNREVPNIIFGTLMDPFAKHFNVLYCYDVSYNKQHYVVYSIGEKIDGQATIGNDGRLIIQGTPILVTDGYI